MARPRQADTGGRNDCPAARGRLFWSMASEAAPTFDDLLGQTVVIDLSSPYVYTGRLVEAGGEFLLLADADVHDLRDTATTREKYVLALRGHGVNANRRWVWVSRREVVGISRLEDVVAE